MDALLYELNLIRVTLQVLTAFAATGAVCLALVVVLEIVKLRKW